MDCLRTVPILLQPGAWRARRTSGVRWDVRRVVLVRAAGARGGVRKLVASRRVRRRRLPAGTPNPPATPIRVLVLTATAGFRHDSIPTAIQALLQIGIQNPGEFVFTQTENLADISADRLASTHVIFFALTTGELAFTDAQKAAIVNFVEQGGGFIGCPQRDGHLVRLVRLRPPGRRVLQGASLDAGGDGRRSRTRRIRRRGCSGELSAVRGVLHVSRQSAAEGARPARRSTPRRSARRGTTHWRGHRRSGRAVRSTPRSDISRAPGPTSGSGIISSGRSAGSPRGNRGQPRKWTAPQVPLRGPKRSCALRNAGARQKVRAGLRARRLPTSRAVHSGPHAPSSPDLSRRFTFSVPVENKKSLLMFSRPRDISFDRCASGAESSRERRAVRGWRPTVSDN